jgi:hypothetical protein
MITVVKLKLKKLQLSSDGSESGTMKCKQGCDGAYGGEYQSLRLARVWSQDVRSVLVRLTTMWLQPPYRRLHT